MGGMVEAQGCGPIKGRPRASWGGAPRERPAGIAAVIAAGGCASGEGGADDMGPTGQRERGDAEAAKAGADVWARVASGEEASVRCRPSGLNGGRRACAWAALAAELGRSGMRGLGRMERETAGWASSWVGFFLFFFSSSIYISNSNQTI